MVLFGHHIVRLLVSATKVMVAVAMLSMGWSAATPHVASVSHVVCVASGLGSVVIASASRSNADVSVATTSVTGLSQSQNALSTLAVNDCCNTSACIHIATIDLLPVEPSVSVLSFADSATLDGRATPVEPRPPRQFV